jgi:hypothetical protein
LPTSGCRASWGDVGRTRNSGGAGARGRRSSARVAPRRV